MLFDRKRAISALTAISAFSVGCASIEPTRPSEAKNDPTPAVVDRDTSEPATDEAPTEVDDRADAVETASGDARVPGDYVTFAFRGSALEAPIRLTERVTARDAESLTVDYTFTDPGGVEVLRVKTSLEGREVRSVERILPDGAARATTIAAFEARMAKTVAIADENEALVSESRKTLEVGARRLEATETTYRVRVGTKAATLRTLAADGFAWGDAGGEIVTTDGKLIYKAELVEMGGGPAPLASLDVYGEP